MFHLTRLLSVANLRAAQERLRGNGRLLSVSGQVATFMLLGIVGVLIFVLMTANLGQMSVQATRAANAADSSALLLGSQLASKSNVLWEKMGYKIKKCVSGGMLGLVLAIVFALIATLLTWYFCNVACGVMVYAAIGAGAGATGGAIGGAVTGGGSGALMGAIQGAIIGAAIGLGVGAGVQWAAAATAAEKAAVTGAILAAEDVAMAASTGAIAPAAAGAGGPAAGAGGTAAGAIAPAVSSGTGAAGTGGTSLLSTSGATVGTAGDVSIAGATGATVNVGGGQLITVSAYSSISAATGGVAGTLMSGIAMHPALVVGMSTLSVGSGLYTASVQEQIKSDAVSHIAKALSGLPESSQFRENTLFQALIQTVDDPNKIQDTEDSDEDGDTAERVPFFQVWWAVRTGQIKVLVSQLKLLAQAFITGPLAAFEGTANSASTPPAGSLVRQEVEGTDGAVVELLRALHAAGKGVTFWTPGPSAAELDTWHEADEEDCEVCLPPASYDDVDFAVDTFQDFVEDASTLREAASGDIVGTNLDNVVGTWDTWMKLFYDPGPENQDDYYDVLGMVVDGGNGLVGMKGWATEIEAIRKGLPECTYQLVCDEFGMNCTLVAVENPPCRGDGTPGGVPATGGTIDADLDDEFTPVQQEIGNLVAAIGPFRSAVQQYYDDMKEVEALLGADQGGTNPVTYAWTDSRGDHSVQAGVGPFKVAHIKKQKSGNFLKKKICLVLKDYSDAETGMPATVTITRQDPPNKRIGFWNWNPHGGTITKVSRVSYSFDRVGVSGTK